MELLHSQSIDGCSPSPGARVQITLSILRESEIWLGGHLTHYIAFWGTAAHETGSSMWGDILNVGECCWQMRCSPKQWACFQVSFRCAVAEVTFSLYCDHSSKHFERKCVVLSEAILKKKKRTKKKSDNYNSVWRSTSKLTSSRPGSGSLVSAYIWQCKHVLVNHCLCRVWPRVPHVVAAWKTVVLRSLTRVAT